MRLILMLMAVGVLSGCAGLIKQPQTKPEPLYEDVSPEVMTNRIDAKSERIKFSKGRFSAIWSGTVNGDKYFKFRLKKGQSFSVSGDVMVWRILKLDGSFNDIRCTEEWCNPDDVIKNLPYSGDYIVQTDYQLWGCKKCSTNPQLLDRKVTVSFSALSPKANRVPQNAAASVEYDFSDKPVKKAKKTTPVKNNYSCGSKNVCGDMDSCEEAYFYLNSCGLSKLDRNHDGVPCETICR